MKKSGIYSHQRTIKQSDCSSDLILEYVGSEPTPPF